MRADFKQIEADYLLDRTVYEYFWDKLNYKRGMDLKREAMEQARQKGNQQNQE